MISQKSSPSELTKIGLNSELVPISGSKYNEMRMVETRWPL